MNTTLSSFKIDETYKIVKGLIKEQLKNDHFIKHNPDVFKDDFNYIEYYEENKYLLTDESSIKEKFEMARLWRKQNTPVDWWNNITLPLISRWLLE
jgi:hypothetical protein